MIEVLIAMVILGAGVMAYVKSSASSLSTNTDTTETLRAAQIVADTNRLFSAHVATLAPGASRQQVISKVRGLQNDMQKQAQALQQAKGYRCEGGQPVLSGKTQGATSHASALQSWVRGPSGCLTISVDETLDPAGLQGVWIETRYAWLSTAGDGQQTRLVRANALVAADWINN